jgi:hypothetical protein
VTLGGRAFVPRWGGIGAFLRVASPWRFTPRVAGDVNGDGLGNDRPSVFDPAQSPDSSLGADMRALLRRAPSRIRDCMVRQTGRIAAINSCSGSPSATLNLTVNPDPYLLRLGNRGSVTLAANNVLAGIDGFESIKSYLAPAKTAPSDTLTPDRIRARLGQGVLDRFAAVLRMRDSLHLTLLQLDSIAIIRSEFRRVRATAYDNLAIALASRNGNFAGDDGRRDWHETLASVRRANIAAWVKVRGLLTPAQYALVPSFIKGDSGLDGALLERVLMAPQLYPP